MGFFTGKHPSGVELVAIGYKYNKKTVLHFVASPNAGSTVDGHPYEMKWSDDHGNIHVRNVPRPEIISQFFQHANSVDSHNYYRQSNLK